VWATGALLARRPGLSPALRHTLPSVAGLATIPLVVPHIDEAVSGWMRDHVRPHLPQAAPCRPQGDAVAAAARQS
jgi:hypothetical protein